MVIDTAGNVLSGRTVTLKLAGTATNATHYSALTGGTSTTGGLVTHTDGTIVDGSGNRRYVDEGAYDLTIAGRTRQIEATSGGTANKFASISARFYGVPGAGLVDETAVLQAASLAALADNKVLMIERGTYNITAAEGTAVLSSGSATITSVTPTTAWFNGLPISGLGIPDGTTVLSGAGTATMVLSANVTASSASAAIRGGLAIRSGSKIEAHPEAKFKVSGAANGVTLYSPTARTPRTTYPLTVNGVLGALTVAVSVADSANFAAGDMVNIRDTTTLGGVANHRESNIVDSVVTASSTATTTSGTPNLTLVSPTTSWQNGMAVYGAGIPAGTTILSGAGTATMVMSANASANAAGVAITGAVTNMKFPLTFNYLTASAAFVAKVTPVQNTHWRGGKFDLTGVGTGTNDRDCIYSDWALDCTVRDVVGTAFPNKVVCFHGAIHCHAERISGYSPAYVGPGQGYVGQFENSRHCSMRTMWGRNCRHVADEVSGSDNLIDGVFAVGRTTDSTTAVLLHGLESRRCRATNVFAADVDYGFQAGNGSFGADYDFEADGMVFHGCIDGVLIAQGCSNFKVTARCSNSIVRAAAVASCVNGEINISYDGIQTNPSNYGAVMIDGSSDGIIARVRGRNAIYKGLLVAASGEVTLVDCDIDMGTVAANGIDATGLSATSIVRVRGGRVQMNNATGTVTGVSLNGPAGSILVIDGTQVRGTMVRGVNLPGASTDQSVNGVEFRGTITEIIRAGGNTGELRVFNCNFTTGTAIRCAVDSGTGLAKLFLGANDWGTATTRVLNSSSALIVGGDNLRADDPLQIISTDAAFTLTPTTSPEETHFTAVMAANRIVTLSTSNVWKGARFKVTRTAASTGAFTLQIGTGPLKSLATSQWAEFVYNGTAWALDQFGSL